jgi:hypothetical protein
MKVGEIWQHRQFPTEYVEIIGLTMEDDYEISWGECGPTEVVHYEFVKSKWNIENCNADIVGCQFEKPREEFLHDYRRSYEGG